ncbi:MAG: DUF6151 family protein [Sulfitobacter sp.]|nr:DUF6151 family protein [Sulfitobacter sp.]
MGKMDFSCACGGVRGTVQDPGPATGTHALCYCDSCRAAELYLGASDPAGEGVHIFQTNPDRVTILSGADRLAPISFSEKGLLRWWATCCGTPMFNTMRSARLSFVGIRLPILADPAAVGPVRGWGFIPKESGKTTHRGLYHILFKAMTRIARQGVTGAWKNTPFFDMTTGKPTAPVEVLPPDTRERVLKRAS